MMDSKAVLTPLKALIARIRADKRLEICVYLLLAALGIWLFAARAGGGEAPEQAVEAITGQSDAAETEARLAETLSCIRGAGEVRVMITYATGEQLVPAMSTDQQISTSESTAGEGVTVNENRTESSRPATLGGTGGNEALVLTERAPEVRGVIVIAEGAADIAVKMKLQSAVQTVLGVEIDRIEVFEMRLAEYGGN